MWFRLYFGVGLFFSIWCFGTLLVVLGCFGWLTRLWVVCVYGCLGLLGCLVGVVALHFLLLGLNLVIAVFYVKLILLLDLPLLCSSCGVFISLSGYCLVLCI